MAYQFQKWTDFFNQITNIYVYSTCICSGRYPGQ